MAGWTILPYYGKVSPSTLLNKGTWDELRNAMLERDTAAGTSYTPAAVAAAKVGALSTRTAYRGAIEDLIPKFYSNSGRHPDVTMTAWDKATIMTECFGAGVTDWPTRKGTIWSAMILNDMRTVLNALDWWRLPDADYLSHSEWGILGYNIQGATMDAAQDAFDAVGGAGSFSLVGTLNYPDAGVLGVDYSKGGAPATPYKLTNWRDSQALLYAILPDVAIASGVFLVKCFINTNTDPIVKQDDVNTIGAVYVDTTTPPTNAAEFVAYGSGKQAGSFSIAPIDTGEPLYSMVLDGTKFTRNTTNYLKITGNPTVDREFSDEADATWVARFRQRKYLETNPYYSSWYFQGDFVYKAA